MAGGTNTGGKLEVGVMTPLVPTGEAIPGYTTQVNIGKDKEGCRRYSTSSICDFADGCSEALDPETFDSYCWDNCTKCDTYKLKNRRATA